MGALIRPSRRGRPSAQMARGAGPVYSAVGRISRLWRALFENVRRPSGNARDDKQRREHRGRNAQEMIGGRAVEIEVGKHVLLPAHHGFDPLGNWVKAMIAAAAANFSAHGLMISQRGSAFL